MLIKFKDGITIESKSIVWYGPINIGSEEEDDGYISLISISRDSYNATLRVKDTPEEIDALMKYAKCKIICAHDIKADKLVLDMLMNSKANKKIRGE